MSGPIKYPYNIPDIIRYTRRGLLELRVYLDLKLQLTSSQSSKRALRQKAAEKRLPIRKKTHHGILSYNFYPWFDIIYFIRKKIIKK